MSIEIHYAGWFQCRLATDRDDFNESRGRFGWTFAFDGEPDLDRVIRFHDPQALRSHAPNVGVFVTAVEQAGVPVVGSPLLGAKVILLDDPVFEGRDGRVASSADEPILPFAIQILSGQLRIEARDPLDITDPVDLLRRQPVSVLSRTPELIAGTGVSNPLAYLQQRVNFLRTDLGVAVDRVAQANLTKRIRELETVLSRGRGIQLDVLLMQLNYEHEVGGPLVVTDPERLLPAIPTTITPWQAEYFFGGWDADALCGYTKGTLKMTT